MLGCNGEFGRNVMMNKRDRKYWNYSVMMKYDVVNEMVEIYRHFVFEQNNLEMNDRT